MGTNPEVNCFLTGFPPVKANYPNNRVALSPMATGFEGYSASTGPRPTGSTDLLGQLGRSELSRVDED